MRIILQRLLVAVAILAFPNLNLAQAPVLGTAGDFVLFSTNGAVTNAGTLLYLTNLTDDCACEGTVTSDCTDGQFQLDRRSEFIVVSK
jgi:hypothetical protein